MPKYIMHKIFILLILICSIGFLDSALAQEGINNTNNNNKNINNNTKVTSASSVKSAANKNINREQFSESDVEMLKGLAERHKKLLQWEKELRDKENLLYAISESAAIKIGELDRLKKEVGQLIIDYKKMENKKISGIVKVYENMKPQEAAQIFESLSINVLMDVASQMQEVKLAAILAKMKTEKAKEITELVAKSSNKKFIMGGECYCQ